MQQTGHVTSRPRVGCLKAANALAERARFCGDRWRTKADEHENWFLTPQNDK